MRINLLKIAYAGLFFASSLAAEAQVANPNADLAINSFNNAFLTL